MRVIHQSGSQGVDFDIARRSEQITVLLNDKTLVAPLPNVTATAVMLVIAADMTGHQPLHATTEFLPPFCANQQVEMIGHQTVGKESDRIALRCLVQQVGKCKVIVVLMKNLLPAVAAIEDVVAMAVS